MSKATPESLTRVNNDVNGNPRYVIHFLELLTEEEKTDWQNRYNVAIAKSRCFGGKKFHNKQYGGGIVFSSYNVQNELDIINKLAGK